VEIHVSDDQRRELKTALDLNDDELFAELGQLAGNSAIRLPLTDAAAEGRRWLRDRQADLRAAVCPHREDICATADTAERTMGILSTLQPHMGGVALVLVAVLIGRLGVEGLCEGSWGGVPSD